MTPRNHLFYIPAVRQHQLCLNLFHLCTPKNFLALSIGNVGLLFLVFLQRLYKQFTAQLNLNYVSQACDIKPFLIDICPNCSKNVIPACQFFQVLAFSSRKIFLLSDSSQLHSRPIKAIMASHRKSPVFQRKGLEKQGSV